MYFTEKQLRIMKFIQQFRSERGISPTMEEIAVKVGVTKITIYDHLNQLERKGALKRERFRARSIEPLVWVGERQGQPVLPLLGAMKCGAALDDAAGQTLDISAVLPLKDKQCFAFRVLGDSLIEEDIRDGDFVIVDRRTSPANGDVVVAVIADGNTTVKRFYREKARIRLEPSKKGQKSIYLKCKDVEILGVVVGLLRNFPTAVQN